MKLKRKQYQRVDASVILRRGNSIIKGSRKSTDLRGRKEGYKKKRCIIRYGRTWKRCTEVRKLNRDVSN